MSVTQLPQPGPRPAFRLPEHGRSSSGSFGQPFFLLRVLVFFTVPFLLVSGALPQLQMLVTGGRVPISSAILKMLLLVAFFAAWLIRGGQIRRNPRLLSWILLLSVYLLLDLVYLSLGTGLKIGDVLAAYNAYYMLAFIAVVSYLVPLKIPERYILGLLAVLAIVCALIGIAQFITHSAILPVQSSDRNFQVVSWQLNGRIRVFSLFESPQGCGLYFVFITALLIALCRRPKYRIFAVPLIFASVGMCYIADARTQLASLICAMVASWIWTFTRIKKLTRYLPVFALLTAIPVFLFGLSTLGASRHSAGVTGTGSLFQRLTQWTYYLSVLRSYPVAKLLFGTGVVQDSKIDTLNASVFVDNIYLINVLFIGLVGLLVYVAVIWAIWNQVREKADQRDSYLHTAVAATLSTFFLMGVFSATSVVLTAYFLLYSITDSGQEPPGADGRITVEPVRERRLFLNRI